MTGPRPRLLIVDDERANLNILGEMLQQDYDVLVSAKGGDTHRLAVKGTPNLILLDILMPDRNGIDVCTELKADPQTRDIPVMFITAASDPDSIVEGFRVGAVDYIQKPLNRVEVKARVRTHLALAEAKASAERALEERNAQYAELQRAQAQLLQSEKMASLGILVAGVAHEINNPINFVHGGSRNLTALLDEFRAFLYQLAGDELTPELESLLNEKFKPMRDSIAAIADGTQRIRSIVQGLQQFSRGDAEEKDATSVVAGLNATLDLVQSNFKQQVRFERSFLADPIIPCWPAQLNQVFMNLAINACQAMVSAGRPDGHECELKVSTAIEGDALAIRFADNGPGIDQDTQKRIFDPFFTTKPVGEGVGLGLSISFGIIQKHQGEIRVASKVGEGTEFTVELPLQG